MFKVVALNDQAILLSKVIDLEFSLNAFKVDDVNLSMALSSPWSIVNLLIMPSITTESLLAPASWLICR